MMEYKTASSIKRLHDLHAIFHGNSLKKREQNKGRKLDSNSKSAGRFSIELVTSVQNKV